MKLKMKMGRVIRACTFFLVWNVIELVLGEGSVAGLRYIFRVVLDLHVWTKRKRGSLAAVVAPLFCVGLSKNYM